MRRKDGHLFAVKAICLAYFLKYFHEYLQHKGTNLEPNISVHLVVSRLRMGLLKSADVFI